MTSLTPMPFPETSFALTLGLLLLAPLVIAGIALVNAGLGRSRSAAQSLLGSLVVISTAVIAFALVGSAIAAGTNGDHVFHLAGRAWNWAGAGPLFLAGFGGAGARTQLAVLYELLSVALVVLIGCECRPALRLLQSLARWCFRWLRIGHGEADGWRSWV
jgi:ammonium transporter, Amt family